MEPEYLERLRRRLVDEQARLRAEGDIALMPNREDAGVTKTDEDAQPLNEMNQTIASRRNAERTVRLRAIDAALRRVTEEPDDFGLCEACEEPIAERRLEVMPWATRCVGCQAKSDPERGGGRRKLTDYV